jgi:hypothetical protein
MMAGQVIQITKKETTKFQTWLFTGLERRRR